MPKMEEVFDAQELASMRKQRALIERAAMGGAKTPSLLAILGL